jgi:hypothetical protein
MDPHLKGSSMMHKVAHFVQISIVMICHYHASCMAESLNLVGSNFFALLLVHLGPYFDEPGLSKTLVHP